MCLWAVLGCGDGLPAPSRVDGLRILALVTDTPEVLPGEGVRVRAVWFHPETHAGRFLWRLCPEAPNGDARECARPTTTFEPVSDADELRISPDALTLATHQASATWVVYVALCVGTDPRFEPSIGHARCASNAAVEAVRRVTVRREGPLNRVPRVARVVLLADGRTITPDVGSVVLDDRAWTVRVEPDADAAEGSEVLMASFYATTGEFTVPRAVGVSGRVTPLQSVWRPGVGVSRLWCVLRDQRGGESVWEGSAVRR